MPPAACSSGGGTWPRGSGGVPLLRKAHGHGGRKGSFPQRSGGCGAKAAKAAWVANSTRPGRHGQRGGGSGGAKAAKAVARGTWAWRAVARHGLLRPRRVDGRAALTVKRGGGAARRLRVTAAMARRGPMISQWHQWRNMAHCCQKRRWRGPARIGQGRRWHGMACAAAEE